MNEDRTQWGRRRAVGTTKTNPPSVYSLGDRVVRSRHYHLRFMGVVDGNTKGVRKGEKKVGRSRRHPVDDSTSILEKKFES